MPYLCRYLFRLSDIVINNKGLEDLGIMNSAVSLEGVTLTRTLDDRWLTIHTKWDNEFFDLLLKDERSYYRNIDPLENALQKIFLLADEDITFSLFMTVYDMVDKKLLPIEKVDQIRIPDFISKKKRSNLICGLGVLYARLRREEGFEKALEKFDLSIEEDAQNPAPYHEKGEVFYFQFKFHDSVKMFKAAIDLDPTSPISYMNIVRPMLQSDYSLDQELAYITKAVDLCKKLEKYGVFLYVAYNNLGTVYLNNGIPSMAEKYYKISNRTKKNERAMYNLGIIYFHHYPNYDKALYYFSEALKMYHEDPRTLEYAIRCLKTLGKDTKAEVLFEDLKKLSPWRYAEMREFYSDPNWRNYEYPFGWRSVGDYPRKELPI